MSPDLRDAEFPRDLETLHQLMTGYVGFLVSRVPPEDRAALQSKYDPAEISALVALCQRVNAPPNGALLIAEQADMVLGCGMMRSFAPGIAELQRIYVIDSARGLGLGRRLTLSLMELARAQGHSLVRLDTGQTFAEAITLYESLGFRECAAYHDQTPEMAHMLRYFEAQL